MSGHFTSAILLAILSAVFTASVVINNYYPFTEGKIKQEEQSLFNENYNFILKNWKESEQRIQELDSKQHVNLFYENVKSE